VDKGKGKAMEDASPVLQKLIMSPTFSIADSDEEDEEQRRVAEEMELDENGRPIPLPSPTDRYAYSPPFDF
jgi:protein phosphatase 1 regulatory subunit 37